MRSGWHRRIAEAFVGVVLALVLAGAPLWAQETDTPPQSQIKVQADSTGALIPEVQRPAQGAVEAGGGATSGGFAPKGGTVQAGGKAPASGGGSSGALDYAGWERMAVRAENATQDRNAAGTELDRLRGQLVDWREALLGAQNANAARIVTLREQIDALGPAPDSGTTEAAEIAKRRADPVGPVGAAAIARHRGG